MSKGIVYYTDGRCNPQILDAARKQLLKCVNGNELVSVSQRPLDFGKNICVDMESSIESMFRQMIIGLEELKADVAFMCEHDVLYHPSHFDFTPERDDRYYFNTNVWAVDTKTGKALYYDDARKTSCLVASRDLLINHYHLKLKKLMKYGWNKKFGFEPGKTPPEGVDWFERERFKSTYPNVDLKHGDNITPGRFDKSKYRHPDKMIGWMLKDEVPFWGKASDFLWTSQS